jgi:carbohydrate diacid regulator
MILSNEVGQRIVGRISVGLHEGISVADHSARVVASTTPQLIGTTCNLAVRAIATGAMVEAADGNVGLSIPLIHVDKVVGAIILHGVARNRMDVAHVAKALAELIIHQATVIEQLQRQQWARSKFIYDLLHEHLTGPAEVVLQEAALFSIDLSIPRIVIIINIEPLVDNLMQQAVPDSSLPTITGTLRLEQIHVHLLDQVRHIVASNEEDVYSFIDDHRLIMLAVVDPNEPDRRRKQIARDVQHLLDDLSSSSRIMTSAGIGRYHPGWPALAQSCVEAQFALETGIVLCGAGRVYHVEELGLASFVCSDNRVTKSELAQHLLQPIEDRPEMLETLTMFFEANLASALTAQALHIHRHTLDYRLNKIAQLVGLDPRDFQAAAQLQAALLVRKTHRAHAQSK